MKPIGSRRAVVSPSLLATVALPFAVPIFLTFGLLILIGNQWPRGVAPESGLKLAGLGAAAITAIVMWYAAAGRTSDHAIRKFAALLCAVTGLMGWPVWTMGVLPSINGSVLDEQRTVRMTLERTEVTHQSKSRALNHWAWLKADRSESVLSSGRYFIADDVYSRWERASPATVVVTVAQGLLGAPVVLGFDP